MEQAEELADWFEAHGPSPDSQRPVEEYYVEYIAEVRNTARSRIAELVVAARNAGASWLQIGEALEISAASAEHRFGSGVELAQATQAESRGLEL